MKRATGASCGSDETDVPTTVADWPVCGVVVPASALLRRTGPADSLRLLLLSTGTSNGVLLDTSEITRSRSSLCFRSATILRISSKPRDILLLSDAPDASSVG